MSSYMEVCWSCMDRRLVDMVMSLVGLHSCVEIVIRGRCRVGGICWVSLACGGLKCLVISLV